MNKKEWIILGFILLAAIFLYLVSFGYIDISGNDEKESFSEKRRKALHRHGKLQQLISIREELKAKLDKKFKIYYFLARTGVVLLWLGANATVYFLFNKGFNDLLTYNEIGLFAILIIIFLRFGNITNVQNIVNYFKTKIENRVYGKYVSLPEKIEEHKEEIKQIESNYLKK